ncbi:hypothetical protein BC831DRAFT_455499 [Entophlyctis helioformis]|nr:hypothetical protein BC831DRAFT_455499 [Entophlyctis helioformis]
MSHTQQTQQTQQTHNEKQTQHGEQVLFSCSAQAKKKSGLLVLTAARLAWTPDAAQTPALAVPYDAIKAQQVNLPGPSGKVLLKLALWPVNGGPETSHALSFAGPSALADRDRVKDILAQRLGGLLSAPASAPASAPTSAPASRPATPAAAAASGTAASRIVLTALDIQARQALLARDKHLARLHKELVMGGLVSEQEFWDTRRQTLINQEWLTVQKRGTSSESLADLRPSATDGDGSDVKYTLTAEIIHSIFTQFPGVHKAYKDNVPEKLTEKEFWTRYLASKYFHRNRVSTLGKDDELFDKYMKEDETDSVLNPKDLSFVARNPLMDLTTTQEDHGETGNRPDTTMRPGNVRSSLPLIRRFNRHSTLVLKQAIKDTPATTAPTAAETDKLFADETVIEDLAPPRVSRFAPLSIQDPTKYFDSLSSTAPGEAATSAAAATAAVSGASRGGVNVAMTHQQLATLQHHLESWMPGVSKLVFASCQSDQGFHVANEMSRKRRANEQQVQSG